MNSSWVCYLFGHKLRFGAWKMTGSYSGGRTWERRNICVRCLCEHTQLKASNHTPRDFVAD
jgi:hypothetical protein